MRFSTRARSSDETRGASAESHRTRRRGRDERPIDKESLFAAFDALRQAAVRRGASIERNASRVPPATTAQRVSDLMRTPPPEALRHFARINGVVCDDDRDAARFSGRFRAPSLREITRDARRVWAVPDDAIAALDRVFPGFISEFGEFLGFDVRGRDGRRHEISLSRPQPLGAFSSLERALRVFASDIGQAHALRDLINAQRVHERLDPEAARRDWS